MLTNRTTYQATSQMPAAHQNGIIRSFVASHRKYLFFKRGFDIVASFLVLALVMSWLTPLIALLIRLDSRGPVIFKQRRVGQYGNPFVCYKFRTMWINDEADVRPAEKNDERVTRMGRLLRASNLDELPQFINVLAGQMSLVGPRPHMPADCTRFSFIISSYSFRHLVRPGITGWAQVNGYHGPAMSYETVMLRYYWDAMYVRKASMWLDVEIIWKTVRLGIAGLFHSLRALFAARSKNAAPAQS